MKILCVSGYAAWQKVSENLMPSHHLFGVHEIIDHYEKYKGGQIRGIINLDIFPEGGYIDFYIWKSNKCILSQIANLLKMSFKYDLIYDHLNRCSIYLGIFKKLGILRCKLLTIMHHPPYDIQLKFFDSDGYIFFNEEYKELAEKSCPEKKGKYYINNWFPDTKWYQKIKSNVKSDIFFIDNGKSKRDRETLIASAEASKIRVDYAGNQDETQGYARSYCINLKDDIGMVQRLKQYHTLIIPVKKNKKNKIGPLGITSFLDSIALGMPVIASDNVCFANEIVKHNIGIVYKTGDINDLSKALKTMQKDQELYDKCSYSMKIYQKNHNIKQYSEKMVLIIKDIVK